MNPDTLTDVDVLVIGGGAIGTSIALHLAEAGVERVQLVERFHLSEGTTWHSAGMVGQLRGKTPIMQIIAHSAALYDQIETTRPGLVDFRRTGSLRLATTQLRLAEMAEQAAAAVAIGIGAEMIDAARVAEIMPTMNVDGVVGACWIPSDGYIDPERLAVGLGTLATEAGATVLEETAVTGLVSTGDRWRVTTTAGEMLADHVVIASGMYSTVVAGYAEVFVPIVCSRQQLVPSKPVSDAVAGYPTLREPDLSMIMRPKGNSLVIGSYAEDPEIELVSGVPARPRFLFEPEFTRMRPVWDAACGRFPEIAEVGEAETIKGPEGITPDGELILGPTGRDNLWIAAGASGHGIAAAGGVGWVMSTWITTGAPPIPVDDFALDRFPSSFRDDPDAMLAEATAHEIGHYAMNEVAQ